MSSQKPSIHIPLLLTATVNPRGMAGANFNPEERLQMYVDAVNFYVRELSRHPQPGGWDIVFAENSSFPASQFLPRLVGADGVRVEYLDLGTDGFDQSRGKGYNETLLIDRAVQQSEAVVAAGCFFKLTGRLKVLNIYSMLRECARRQHRADGLHFLADCKDHGVYEFLALPINGHAGECRYWFASVDFFRNEMMPHLDEMNDYSVPPVLAEDVMLVVCRKARSLPACHDRFLTQARISGRGGHDLGKGSKFFHSTDNDSFALRLKCTLRQLLRWTMPWWRA